MCLNTEWFKRQLNIWLKGSFTVLLLAAMMYHSVSQDGSAWSNLPSLPDTMIDSLLISSSQNELEMQIWWKGSHHLGIVINT